jgi:hypothetical protein
VLAQSKEKEKMKRRTMEGKKKAGEQSNSKVNTGIEKTNRVL